MRVVTSTGRRLTTLDLTAIVDRLGAPVRMVPRRVLLDRLLDGLPTDRIRYNSRAVGVVVPRRTACASSSTTAAAPMGIC